MKRRAVLVLIIPLAGIVYLIVYFIHLPWTPLRIFGLIAAIAGFIAVTIARVQLGDSFSVRPEARELVTRGIYTRIRNPIYVFSAIAIAGLLLYIDQPKLLLFFVILIPIQMFRARKESQVLEAHFGDAYRRYKSQTWL